MKGGRLTRLVLLVGVVLAMTSIAFACSDREARRTTRTVQQHSSVSGIGVASNGVPVREAPGRLAGVERAHPHLFRHSTGVAFLHSGGSESVLQLILGHASREMVEHYMHLADTDVTQLHRRHNPLDHL